MIFATPFVPELTDFTKYAADITRKGALSNHIHVVISELDDEDEAFAFGTSLSDFFLKTQFVVLPDVGFKRSKPQLANDLFRAAVNFMDSHVTEDSEISDPPMLYSDPTYRPQKTQWLNAIQSEFYQNNMPAITGVSVPDADGCKIFQGPVILGPKFPKITALLDFLPASVHWRTHLRWDLSNNSHETKLIGAGSESVLKALTKK